MTTQVDVWYYDKPRDGSYRRGKTEVTPVCEALYEVTFIPRLKELIFWRNKVYEVAAVEYLMSSVPSRTIEKIRIRAYEKE